MSRSRIIHVTTVHAWWDNRIYEKMVLHLEKAGFEVHLVARRMGRNSPEGTRVRFHWLDSRSGRVGRVWASVLALWLCLRIGRGLVHFHDPELIFVGLVLRAFGYGVIYDVHEDNLLAIRHKDYLPRSLRPAISAIVKIAEGIAARAFTVVLAERIYLKRFSRGTLVLNYMDFGNVDECIPPRPSVGQIRMLYTGTVTEARGALNHVGLVKRMPEAELWFVGRCSSAFKEKLQVEAGAHTARIRWVTTEEGVPFSKIRELYERGGWTCGLALFPISPHYEDKELTKFYEFMCYGIPIVCSNFPVWSELINASQAGIAVSPDDYREAENAVRSVDRIASRTRMREVAIYKYSWSSQLERLVALYADSGFVPRA